MSKKRKPEKRKGRVRRKPKQGRSKAPVAPQTNKRQRGHPKGAVIYSDEMIEKAIVKNYGLVTQTAKMLGCSEETVYNHLRGSDRLKAVLKQCRVRVVDETEQTLFLKAKLGDNWCIGKVLDTLGKDRGYGSAIKHEHSGPDGGPIKSEQVFAVEQRRSYIISVLSALKSGANGDVDDDGTGRVDPAVQGGIAGAAVQAGPGEVRDELDGEAVPPAVEPLARPSANGDGEPS